MKSLKFVAILPIALFCFAINPAVLTGCSATSSANKYSFGESEMRSFIVGQWQSPVTFKDGSTGTMTVDLKQANKKTALLRPGTELIQTASACGSREFIKTAAACLDTSHMPVTGTMTVTQKKTDGTTTKLIDNKTVNGKMMVIGHNMNNAHLDLKVDDSIVNINSRDGKTFVEGTLRIASQDEAKIHLKRVTK